MLRVSSPFILSSSRSTSCVTWSSSSTRSRPSTMSGKSSYFFLLTSKRPSMTYCTRLSISPSWRMLLKRSKIARVPEGESACMASPHSWMKLTHTSMESSVTRSSSKVATCNARSSLTTFWLTRCAMNFMAAVVTILSFRLYARRNCKITRRMRRSPTSGSFEFRMATRAAKTCVKPGEAICARMIARTNRPRPRTRFSWNNSSTMFLMFETFTLLTKPLILLRKASHTCRWYSGLVLSSISFCKRANLKGGM
mmetsp:Transcript_112693/g.318448  ORF Transcript_112693/g.318448 Transcript_112693/m.318448 type:complete len:253 (+) Transcript_112693:993-1751(+)